MATINKPYQTLLKSNSIILGKYNLSLAANRLLDIALLQLQLNSYDEGEDLIVILSVNSIERITGNNISFRSHIKELSNSLKGQVIGIEDNKTKKFHYVSIISEVVYNGKLSITFNKSVQPLLTEFKSRFTELSFAHVMSLESVYSYRLYQIVRSIAYPGSHKCYKDENNTYHYTIDLAELRFVLGLVDINEEKVREVLDKGYITRPDYNKALSIATQVKHRNWRDLKKNAIDRAIKEISKKTDIILSFETQGKPIDEVTFLIRHKEKHTKTASQQKQDEKLMKSTDTIAEVKKIIDDISDSEAQSLLAIANNDLNVIKEKYKFLMKQRNIENKMGWLVAAIRDDYKTHGINKRNNWYCTTHESGYDFEQLEELLLDN